ncbi:MAG: hypothetical protein WD269_10320 [Acidimicrobiia bacterium]
MVRPTLRSLSAGQIDSAFSSVATFVAGLYAVRVFDATTLGAYVVVFTAWNLARTLPSEMVYTPSEVVAVGHAGQRRIHILSSSMQRGFLLSLLGAVGVLASSLVIHGDIGQQAALALTVTGAAVTIIAPMLDHWRKMFHIAHASWRAAVTAAAQMVATIVLILVLDGRVHPAWIPFGAIAAGYALSGIVALLLTTPLMRTYQGGIERPEWVELSRVGRWLLLANLAAFGSDFVLVLIAKAALGPDVLGYAEAARVVARPVIVLGVGLAAVLGPRSVQAGMGPDPQAARSPRRVLWLFSCLGGLLYLPLVGLDWTLNPLPSILPNAYAVKGLVAVTIAGAIIFNFALPWWYELLGARRQRELARTEMVASILKVATGLAASLLQAFTLPVAWGIAFMARGIGLDFYARRLFKAGSPGPTEAQGPESRARGDG